MVMQRTASVAAACGMLAAASLFSVAMLRTGFADIAGFVQSTSAGAEAAIARGFDMAPALMLGLAILAAVPLIAVISPLVFRATRPEGATRRYRPSHDSATVAEFIGEHVPAPARVFLEAVGSEHQHRFVIARDMLRIGREDDNDIRITNRGVHRYHAAIYREDFDAWFIADLSGIGGNGVRLNGAQCNHARLKDGDIIQLGPGRLRFRAA